MHVVRRRHKHSIDVLGGSLEHHSIVDVHGTTTPWFRPGFVMVLLDRLHGGSTTAVVSVVEVAVVPVLGYVANGRYLDIRVFEQIPNIDDPLTACANDGHV